MRAMLHGAALGEPGDADAALHAGRRHRQPGARCAGRGGRRRPNAPERRISLWTNTAPRGNTAGRPKLSRHHSRLSKARALHVPHQSSRPVRRRSRRAPGDGGLARARRGVPGRVDAASAGSDGRVLVAPRLEDRYASHGVIARVERVGRFSSGGPAAVLKAEQRGRIGSGVSGPGAALWVEVEPVEDHVTDRARELAEEYKRLVVAVLQRREAWQVIDQVHQMSDPSAIADAAGYAPYLSADRKRELLENPDVEAPSRDPDRLDPRPPRRVRAHRQDRRGRPRGDGEEPARVPAPPAARRDPQGARRGRAGRARTTTAAGSRPPTCRTPCARHCCARSTSSSAPATRARRPRGSGPGSTPCSSCRGTSPPRTPPTSSRRAPCSTPTTTASTRSRSGSSSTSPCAPVAPSAGSRSSAAGVPARSSCWPVLPVSARPRSASRSPTRSAGSSSASPSVASATRPRSAATAGRTSGRCPAASCAPSRRPAR